MVFGEHRRQRDVHDIRDLAVLEPRHRVEDHDLPFLVRKPRHAVLEQQPVVRADIRGVTIAVLPVLRGDIRRPSAFPQPQ